MSEKNTKITVFYVFILFSRVVSIISYKLYHIIYHILSVHSLSVQFIVEFLSNNETLGSISTVGAKISIKRNLGYFSLPGDPGPLSWGYLSPFRTKEDCLVQFKVR